MEGKSRPKSRESEITIESPEFQLLVRLYVPAKLLIRNNKVLRRQLAAYLPVIVNDSLPDLNFELHIFLSTIVTTYVSSWYLSKLNTDNFDFLASVYGILCDFVKEFARRVLLVVELPHLLDLVDDWAYIVDSHIKQVQPQNNVPQMVSDYLSRHSKVVCCDMDESQIIQEILLESHAIFNRTVPAVAQRRDLGEQDDSNDTLSVRFHGQATGETENSTDPEPEPLQVYLRVVVRNILSSTFDSALIGSGPTSSAIVTNLLTVILADLVLTKVVTVLASPSFILRTSNKVLAELQKRKSDEPPPPIHKRVTSFLKQVYVGVSRVIIALSGPDVSGLFKLSIMFSPVLSLIDTVTGFSGRQPVVSHVAGLARSVVLSVDTSGKIDNALRTYWASAIQQSPALDDRFLASVVQTVLEIVFSRNSDSDESEAPEPSVHSVSTAWLNYFRGVVPVSWFRYRAESEDDMEQRIEAFFSIFDNTNSLQNSSASEPTQLNTLLVIRLFDSVVQYLYPELVVGFSAGQKLSSTDTTP